MQSYPIIWAWFWMDAGRSDHRN